VDDFALYGTLLVDATTRLPLKLGLDRRTVRRYARARTWQEVMRRPSCRPSVLDAHFD
jgi:hypothetical protein